MMGRYVAKQADASGLIHFTTEENETWQILIERQDKIVQSRASQAFLDGLAALQLPRDHVPQCSEVNKVLMAHTGWSIAPVPALIPQSEFYNLLAHRQFPAASFIRTRAELDYLQEPDIFHEIYGHCPLLTNQAYADFVQWYGATALQANQREQRILARLFWFTVEFGLIKNKNTFSIYGAGILSSKEETIYAVESDIPKHVPFNALQALRTPYRYDKIQPLYFHLETLEDLYQIQAFNLSTLVKHADTHGDLEPGFTTC